MFLLGDGKSIKSFILNSALDCETRIIDTLLNKYSNTDRDIENVNHRIQIIHQLFRNHNH